MKSLVVIVFLTAFAAASNGQETAHVVTYENAATGKGAGKMPDLKKTVVGINFDGPLADELRGWLIKKGVRRFVEGKSNRCRVGDQAVVCFSIGQPTSSGTYSGSGYAGNGNGYAGGNWSLNQIGTRATADLIRANGDRVALGYALGWSDAGTSSESGGGPNGYGSSTTMTPVQIAAALAQRMAIMRLVDHYKLWELGNHTKMWYPNAAAEIATAFK